jgi:hypothetical protein
MGRAGEHGVRRAAGSSGCGFRECTLAAPASLALRISPAPDGAPVTVWAHDACFARLRHTSVEYDHPKDHGRIPRRARCVFCGDSLPIVGEHALAFDVGDSSPAHRYWAHHRCMVDRLLPAVGSQLAGGRGGQR